MKVRHQFLCAAGVLLTAGLIMAQNDSSPNGRAVELSELLKKLSPDQNTARELTIAAAQAVAKRDQEKQATDQAVAGLPAKIQQESQRKPPTEMTSPSEIVDWQRSQQNKVRDLQGQLSTATLKQVELTKQPPPPEVEKLRQFVQSHPDMKPLPDWALPQGDLRKYSPLQPGGVWKDSHFIYGSGAAKQQAEQAGNSNKAPGVFDGSSPGQRDPSMVDLRDAPGPGRKGDPLPAGKAASPTAEQQRQAAEAKKKADEAYYRNLQMANERQSLDAEANDILATAKQLASRKSSLKFLVDDLEARIKAHNARQSQIDATNQGAVDSYNSERDQLNREAGNLNASIKQHDGECLRLAERGKQFEQRVKDFDRKWKQP
ncbi:MAG TPA: hypothetical protein VGZ47_11930 [Gemmataceae bacterium]|jgi:hypothetical protein|nr:hypothetical protein [Gemmataceae bacterium]